MYGEAGDICVSSPYVEPHHQAPRIVVEVVGGGCWKHGTGNAMVEVVVFRLYTYSGNKKSLVNWKNKVESWISWEDEQIWVDHDGTYVKVLLINERTKKTI